MGDEINEIQTQDVVAAGLVETAVGVEVDVAQWTVHGQASLRNQSNKFDLKHLWIKSELSNFVKLLNNSRFRDLISSEMILNNSPQRVYRCSRG